MSLPLPSVRHYLSTLAETKAVPRSELGTIPETHAEALQELRQTHWLAVISDISSPSVLFLHEFERAGVTDVFELLLFSSEHGYVKPASLPFQTALSVFQGERSKIVFAGDNFKRNIVGAKGGGLAEVWINAQPDLIIKNLPELLTETRAKCGNDKNGHNT